MTDVNNIAKFKDEIKKAVLAYENGEFVDIQTETTELVLLAKQYTKKSTDSKAVAIAISELIPSWVENGGEKTWGAVDYLIEQLELDKTKSIDHTVISEMLEFFIGNDKPADSIARFFLLEAFVHSGGKIQQSTILKEEAYFKKDNPSFWLGLVIDNYKAEYFKGRIIQYIEEGLIDIRGLTPLIPEIYDKVDEDFPSIMISFIEVFDNQESKEVLEKLFKSYMGESKEEYLSKIQNKVACKSNFANNIQFKNYLDQLNFPNLKVSDHDQHAATV